MTNSALYIYYTPSYQTLADIVLSRVRSYCERHGYAYEVVCSGWSVLPTGSYKMHVLLQVLEKYDFVWVLDLDTLITNPEIPFTKFVDNYHDVFMCIDLHGLNAGSWIARRTDITRIFINNVISNFDAPEEQTVMKRFIDKGDVILRVLPHPSINSYMYELYKDLHGEITIDNSSGQWCETDLLLHLPGLSLEKRIEIFGGMI